jgi:hypothetical protein
VLPCIEALRCLCDRDGDDKLVRSLFYVSVCMSKEVIYIHIYIYIYIYGRLCERH